MSSFGQAVSIESVLDVDGSPAHPGDPANEAIRVTPVVAAPFGTVSLTVTGQQAVTAVATALPSNTAKEVCLRSLITGTQTVFYGPSGVTIGTGQELVQGDKFCAPVPNSNQFFVIASGAGSTVAFEVYN